jgi:hypothetical protein
MAIFRIVNSQSIPLTRELAQAFHKMQASPTERDLNPARLQHLQSKFDAGLTVSFNWAKARLGKDVYRVNGQHSSALLAQMNGNFPEGLTVHMDEYQVDGTDGLALLFRQFDDRKSGRSPGDVSGAYQGLVPELMEVSKQTAKYGIEGYVWYQRLIENVPVPSGDDIYTLYNETATHPFLLWLSDLFSIKTPELVRKPVVAAMYATFVANETAARDFWNDVMRGGVEFEDDAPQTVLDKWLKEAADKATKAKYSNLKPANFYEGCMFAWKAFREDRSIREIKFGPKYFVPASA